MTNNSETVYSSNGEFGSWKADIDKMNELWDGNSRMTSVEDAFSLSVFLSEKEHMEVPTHLFGDVLTIIPYDDGDNAKSSNGNSIGRGDIEISKYYKVGEIGFAIKHHRPNHRSLSPEMLEGDAKEDLKLQDTHIELVVGVEREGSPGVITLNNPQDYQNGRFGEPDYPMIFVKPVYPEYLPEEKHESFQNNIRTMMVGFNAVSNFPRNYNGGDPLAVYSPEKLQTHVKQMILAIAGDSNESSVAREWFNKEEHMIYCAELAYVSASAGLLFPLNKSTCVPLVGNIVWDKFVKCIEAHNAGEDTPFVALNRNKLSRLIKLELAPVDLCPIVQYAHEDNQHEESQKLAFVPMTMADIVRYALATYIPREELGESVAPMQAKVLEKMKPGLIEAMAMDNLPLDDPRRVAVDALFSKIINVIGKEYDSYETFEVALSPHMENARQMTGPRPGCEKGKGFFVPPSLFHVITQGEHQGGLLGLEYIGHGLHFSLVYQ